MFGERPAIAFAWGRCSLGQAHGHLLTLRVPCAVPIWARRDAAALKKSVGVGGCWPRVVGVSKLWGVVGGLTEDSYVRAQGGYPVAVCGGRFSEGEVFPGA